LRHDFATVHARTRAKIDNVIRAAHRFLVVLDDDERISLFAKRSQRIEQPANCLVDANRLSAHRAHKARRANLIQVARQADSLGFAAAQGFGRTPEREITEPDVFHKAQTLLDLRQQFRCDCVVRPRKRSSSISFRRSLAERAVKLSMPNPWTRT